MAVNMFLKMGEIQGESQNKDYRDQIEVQGWSWGVSQTNPGRPGPGTGSAAGRSNIQNFSVTKWVDKATPEIYKQTLNGRTIRECKFTCCRKDGGKFLEIAMSECVLASVLTGGKYDEERLTENLVILFSRVEISYFYKDATGKLLTVKSGWDVNRNAPV